MFGSVALLGMVLGAWALATPAAPPSEPAPLRSLVRSVRTAPVMAGIWLVALGSLTFGVLGVLVPLELDRLGAATLAVALTFLLAAGVEALVAPVAGRLSDRRGRAVPITAALCGATLLLLALPWPGDPWLLAGLMLAAGAAIGVLWAPSMAMLSDGAEASGLDQGLAFALVNLAWAGGQVTGSSAGGAVAQATGDAVPYLALAGLYLVTLVGVRIVAGRRASSVSEV